MMSHGLMCDCRSWGGTSFPLDKHFERLLSVNGRRRDARRVQYWWGFNGKRLRDPWKEFL